VGGRSSLKARGVGTVVLRLCEPVQTMRIVLSRANPPLLLVVALLFLSGPHYLSLECKHVRSFVLAAGLH
jgi:hypothetical protein